MSPSAWRRPVPLNGVRGGLSFYTSSGCRSLLLFAGARHSVIRSQQLRPKKGTSRKQLRDKSAEQDELVAFRHCHQQRSVAAHQDSAFDGNQRTCSKQAVRSSCFVFHARPSSVHLYYTDMAQLADTGQAHTRSLDTEGYFVVHLGKVKAEFLLCIGISYPFHINDVSRGASVTAAGIRNLCEFDLFGFIPRGHDQHRSGRFPRVEERAPWSWHG